MIGMFSLWLSSIHFHFWKMFIMDLTFQSRVESQDHLFITFVLIDLKNTLLPLKQFICNLLFFVCCTKNPNLPVLKYLCNVYLKYLLQMRSFVGIFVWNIFFKISEGTFVWYIYFSLRNLWACSFEIFTSV